MAKHKGINKSYLTHCTPKPEITLLLLFLGKLGLSQPRYRLSKTMIGNTYEILTHNKVHFLRKIGDNLQFEVTND